MSITRAAILNDRLTLFALVAVFTLGASAYFNLPRAEDPGFTIRTARVMTIFPGASPERVASLITDKLETVIQEIPEVDNIVSTSKTGVSLVTVNIKESETDMRPIWDTLRRKVEQVTPDLPEGTRTPEVQDELGDVFGIVFTLTSDGFTYAQMEDAAKTLRNELLLLPDVAKVNLAGVQDERIYVEFTNSRLAELGLSSGILQQALEAENITMSGGEIKTGTERLAIEPTGNFESVDDLRQTLIQIPSTGELLALEDIANIRREYIDPPSEKVRANTQRALTISVSMREGGNISKLGEAIDAALPALKGGLPIGLELEKLVFSPTVVNASVDDFVNNLVQSMVIVLLVMLVTLGLRTGLLVASLIPMTMIASLMLMNVLDIGLDRVSLAALIIALGMLVDNAIVMAESIMVNLEAGKSRMDAAVEAAAELQIPLLVSSMTTSAAFLPIYLAESAVGEFTSALFEVVSIALLCSWTLALTMIPLLCKAFMKVKVRDNDDTGEFNSPFYRAYRAFLVGILKQRVLTVVIVGSLFVGALSLFRFIPNVFFPPDASTYFTLELTMAPGTAIETTEETVLKVEQFIIDEMTVTDKRTRGVTTWGSFIGQGAPKFNLSYTSEPPTPSYAILLVNISHAEDLAPLMRKLEVFCLANIPGSEVKIRGKSSGPPVSTPIEVRVFGPDRERVFAIVDTIKAQLTTQSGTKNIRDNWGMKTKKLVVDVASERARRAGVTNQDVAISLMTVFSGFKSTEFREGTTAIPVQLRSVEAERQDLAKIEELNITNQNSGNSVPLLQVADVDVLWQPSKILRRDRRTAVSVLSDLDETVTATEVNNAMLPWLEEQKATWGTGYNYELGGESESSDKANASIADKLPLAAVVIILLLISQFNSIRRPAIILLTIPMGMIGVIPGLLLAQQSFGFMTMLGVISLAGIVINNAIVLLDRIAIELAEGRTPQDAVVEAGQRRLRPIILTTMTTIGGLIPLYLGGGSLWESMAIAIMAGLLVSTLLTLGVVPVLYALFFGISYSDHRYNPQPTSAPSQPSDDTEDHSAQEATSDSPAEKAAQDQAEGDEDSSPADEEPSEDENEDEDEEPSEDENEDEDENPSEDEEPSEDEGSSESDDDPAEGDEAKASKEKS